MSTTLIPVNLEYVVDGSVCGDIAITAAEGGIGYWSQIEKYDYRRWIPEDDGVTADVADDFVFYMIREWDENDLDYSGRPIRITPALIKRGIGLYLNGSPNTQARNVTEIDELNAVDSNEADLIIQLGAFGKAVYG